MTDTTTFFSGRLLELRLNRRWTARQLAAATFGEVSAKRIAALEAGKRSPKLNDAHALAKAFGVTIASFIVDE
jgi:transcriptional regulator with XRE-family HTH domain